MATYFYYPAFDVAEIDSDGFLVPVPSITLDVYNVTGSSSLGTVSVDADGRVSEGSFPSNVGDVIEWSHVSYPRAFRQTLTDTQENAYLHVDNHVATFILASAYGSTTDVQTAELYAQDLDDMGQRPVFLGLVKAGETTNIPYQSSLAKNIRFQLVSKDDSGAQDQADFAYTQFVDVSIPALVTITPASGHFLYGAFSINDNDDSNKLAIRWAENSAADRILNLLVNGASRTIDLSGNLTVPANATVSGTNTGDAIVVGTTALSSGTNDRPLYQAAGVVTQSTKWRYDGSDMTMIDPTAATGGAPTVNSPKFILTGEKWRTDTTVSEGMKVRFGVVPNTTNVAGVNSPTLQIDAYSNYASDWGTILSIGQLSSDYLVTRFNMRNPHNAASWGGMMDVYYNGEFRFKDVAGDPSSMVALSFGKGSGLGYEQFFVNAYSPEIRTHFNNKILFAAGRPAWKYGDNAGNSGSEYVQSDLPISIGVGGAPTAKFHVIGTTEQVRIGYDAANYYKTTVGSTGGVTFDAVGAGAGFTFSDDVSVPDEAYDPTAWNGSLEVPTKNAVRDLWESMSFGDINDLVLANTLTVNLTSTYAFGTYTLTADLVTKPQRTLVNHYTDAATPGTTTVNLYTYTVPAGTLTNNGDMVRAEYSGIFTTNTHNKRIFLKFNGTVLVTGDTSSAAADHWTVDLYIMRVSNTVVRYAVEFTTTGDAVIIQTGEITGLNLTTTGYALDLDARTVTAAGEATAKSGYAVYVPAP